MRRPGPTTDLSIPQYPENIRYAVADQDGRIYAEGFETLLEAEDRRYAPTYYLVAVENDQVRELTDAEQMFLYIKTI